MVTKSKTSKIESTGKVTAKTGSKAVSKVQPVSSKKAPVTSEAACRICGKPLTTPESIEAGIGPECASREENGGWTLDKITEHREALTVESLPKGYISLREVEDAAVEQGIPRSRVLKAAGGNRGLGEPLYPEFALLFHNGKRYLPGKSITALSKIAGETKRTPPVPKTGKIAKAAKKSKAPEEAPESGPVRGAKKGKQVIAKGKPTITKGKSTVSKGKPAEQPAPIKPVSKVQKAMPTFGATPAPAPAPARSPKVKTVRKAGTTGDGVPVLDVIDTMEEV